MCKGAWCRGTRTEIVVKIRVVEERHRTAHIRSCIACQKCENYVIFISLNLNAKRLEKSYQVPFFNGKMRALITGKLIVFGTCDG